jgi:hypothetical protein
MRHAIDLRSNEPRSAHEALGGVKLLARIIDKGSAAISGTLGSYLFFDCPLDRVFFEAANVSRTDFLEVLQETYAARLAYNVAALADLREAVSSEREISDETFMTRAEASDLDNAAVRWLLDQKGTPASVLAAINNAVDSLPSEAFIDWNRKGKP